MYTAPYTSNTKLYVYFMGLHSYALLVQLYTSEGGIAKLGIRLK